MFSKTMQKQIETTANVVTKAQTQWPAAVQLRIKANLAIYDGYPYLFQAAFPQVKEEDVLRLAAAGRLFASSFFLYDPLMDRNSSSEIATNSALRIVAMQHEAHRQLQAIFPGDSSFWNLFQQYLVEYADACLTEQAFATGQIVWKKHTEERALQTAIGKNGIARASVAGLAELAGDYDALQTLCHSINCYNIAYQMLDDLMDWREDWKAHLPSVLLTRLVPERNFAIIEQELAQRIYYEGHAQYIMQLACDQLSDASSVLQPYPHLEWQNVLDGLHHRCHDLLLDIEQIVQKNVTSRAHRPDFTWHFPEPQSEWQDLAWDGLRYLAQQWQLGWGEARHQMPFAREQGFTSLQEHVAGDVFQRALFVDTLCDANEQMDNALQTVLDYEVRYLRDIRDRTELGGWRYFPELPELPPDADDLGQVLQSFWRTGRQDWIKAYCDVPLQILLEDNRHPDGSLETWIIPAEGRSDEQERQALYARIAWGRGPDPDVIANLLYALWLYDAEHFEQVIYEGVDFLESKQEMEGSWYSSWYHGPYYGTYVCARLFRATLPHSRALSQAINFVQQTQQADGGWGINGDSDPLNTALALLCLSFAPSEKEIRNSAEQALIYLQRQQVNQNGWRSVSFIRMELGRASGQIQKILSYGSCTVTTNFVIKSALAWHNRLATFPDDILQLPQERILVAS